MSAPPFDVNRAARDYVAALPRKATNGKRVERRAGDVDTCHRVLASLSCGDERANLAAFIFALGDLAAEALDALEARDGGTDG